jgi:hypothetical protein
VIRDEDEREIARLDGVLGEDFEVALRIDDDEPVPSDSVEQAAQVEGIADLALELEDVRPGGYEVDAVLPQLHSRRQVPPAHRARHGLVECIRREREHAVDRGLLVEAEDEDRQILLHGAQVDRQVGGNGSLSDSTLVARHRQHLIGARAAPPVLRSRIGECVGPVTDDLRNAIQESAHAHLLLDEAPYWTRITPKGQQSIG